MTTPLPDELLRIPHRRDLPFARLTTLGVGGLCRWLFEPTTEGEAQAFVRACRRHDLPFRVLGGGSNLLVLGDIATPVLRLRLGEEPRVAGAELWAGASAGHMALADRAAEAGLSGLEWAGGIPGSLGGAVRMNAGAHGASWERVLARLSYLTPEGERVERVPEPGDFRYRGSFLEGGCVLLSATARLVPGNPDAIRARLAEFRTKRKATQPGGVRSAGCIFRNPPGDHAGRLIEAAGLKGLRIGEAEVSPVHANFLVNLGAATPGDFLALVEAVRARVRERFGVALETEVELWRD